MACNVQDWSLRDLSDALNNKHIDKKKIAVPMFQRGTRWKREQEEKFIDSLRCGFPVGTLLFYETIENNQSTYLLVDGLQRGNTIRKYITRPTDFFSIETITEDVCKNLLVAIKEEVTVENVEKVKQLLIDFIKQQQSYANLQYFEPARALLGGFSKEESFLLIDGVTPILREYFRERQDRYTQIAQTIIPVVVYQGDAVNLDEIFKRINSQGTPLDQYEVYAAAWPSVRTYKVDNGAIVDAVIKKYTSMEAEDFEIYGYDAEKIKKDRCLTAFEYLFGLSKVLTQTVDILRFIKQGELDDEVNALGFELVNACLNDSNKIPELYKHIAEFDINLFEKALMNAIKFVQSSVAVITRFKGNNHKKNKIFHSKFQIMSMISTTFKEMYPSGDFSKESDEWSKKKTEIARNLLHYYVYDILMNTWSEGGTGKIFAAAKPNRYGNAISSRAWSSALEGYFERTMQRVECKKVSSPGKEEYVFLNCIYLHTFSAIDQLSAERFDIEHLAPKEQLKKLIKSCGGDNGLPISSVANLCYLPEAANRAKGAKTLYQDKNYLSKVSLQEVEEKFSFTDEEDLDWMDREFLNKEDFSILKEMYEDFCAERFKELKRRFCNSMNIEFIEDASTPSQVSEDVGATCSRSPGPGKMKTPS